MGSDVKHSDLIADRIRQVAIQEEWVALLQRQHTDCRKIAMDILAVEGTSLAK